MLTLDSLQSMTLEQRWKVIDNHKIGKRELPTVKPCKPDWLSVLYTNTPMPHLVTERLRIVLGEKDVHCGTLWFDGRVEMRWNGYVCQLYDGELKMGPITFDASITGVCDGKQFAFKGTVLDYGVWPGFLLLYKL